MYLVGCLVLSSALAAYASEVTAARAVAQREGHGTCLTSAPVLLQQAVQPARMMGPGVDNTSKVSLMQEDPVDAPPKRDVYGCRCGPGSPISDDKKCCHENKFNWNGHNCIVDDNKGATCKSSNGKSLCCKDHANAWCCPEGTACIPQTANQWNPNSCTEIQNLTTKAVKTSWSIVGGGPGSPGMPIKFKAGVTRKATRTEVNDIENEMLFQLKFGDTGFSYTNTYKWTKTVVDSITKKQNVECSVKCPKDYYAWAYYTKIDGIDTLTPEMKHLFASCSAVICSPFGKEKPPVCPFGYQANQKNGFDCCTSLEWANATQDLPPKCQATTTTTTAAAVCDIGQWSDVVSDCGSCKARVQHMGNSDKYGGRCSTYCEQQGLACVAQHEDVADNCAIEWTGSCTSTGKHGTGASSPDLICECAPQASLGQVAVSEVRPEITEVREVHEMRLMQDNPVDAPLKRDVYGCACGPGSPISDDKKCCHENKFNAEGHNCIVGGGKGVTCKSSQGKSLCCKDHANAWCCPEGTACIPQKPNQWNPNSCTKIQNLTTKGVKNSWSIVGGGPGAPENMPITFTASVDRSASETEVNSIKNAFEVSHDFLGHKFSNTFTQSWSETVQNEVSSNLQVTCSVQCPKDHYLWAFSTQIDGIDTIPTSWKNLWASCSAVVCSPYGEVKPPACPFGYQGHQQDGFDCCTSNDWAHETETEDSLPPLCSAK
eukprot:TRINITY_DN1957_c0_g1_i1.p1 TRINITY_DN1957_c0_g1~~TRINITY_DN1957_c0_g1_i1.p1  ORF type:complete len:714 (+),score=117.67 TRINITY_DN1957_c0_g1_i1:81-2222(+)